MRRTLLARRFCSLANPTEILFHPSSQTPQIKGLQYFSEYISDSDAHKLESIIDSNTWLSNIRRRQQHYGVVYYHTAHNLSEIQPESPGVSEKALDLTQFQWIIDRLVKDSIFSSHDPPNQCLVNEYDKKDKLGCHVENIHAFGPIIAGVSLCQPSYLTLRKIGDPKEKLLIYLEPRSLYVLASDSRYLWEHGVGKMNEIYNPRTQQTLIKGEDYRRLSLTFRHVVFEGTKKVQKGAGLEDSPNFYRKQ